MGNSRTLSFFLFYRLPTFSSHHFVTPGLPFSTISKKSDAKRNVDPIEPDTIEDVRAVFDDMLHRYPRPSLYDFTRLFGTIARMKHHSTVISMSRELEFSGIGHTPSLFCSIASVALDLSDMLTLGKIFKFGLQPDAFTFNSLINGLCLSGKVVESVRLLDKMISLGCEPNLITCNTIVNGLCKTGDNDGALKVLRAMEERGFHPDVLTYNTIIDSLCKDKLISEARNLLSEMIGKGIQPDVVTFNSLIHSMCNADQQLEATNLLNEMVAKGVNPDVVTYNILVDSLCKGEFLKLEILLRDCGNGGSGPTSTHTML